jgi:hypothetical protein
MTKKSTSSEAALRFAGKCVAIISASIIALRLIGMAFAFSRWTGFLAGTVISIVLLWTASRWVKWLPGLLIFGVVNSVAGLISHRVPTNSEAPLSSLVAALLVIFYTGGCIVASRYDATHLSAFDRGALLAYLFCMIWPAFLVGNNLADFSPIIGWSVGIGVTALVLSFLNHSRRRQTNWRSRHRALEQTDTAHYDN